MREFHLQARRFVGPLARPERNDTRLAESDCWNTIRTRADTLAQEGFTVWIFRAGARSDPGSAPPGLRLVTTIKPPS